MATHTETEKPPRSFWIVSSAALVWNTLGIVTYLMSVTMSPETLAEMSEAERSLYADNPVWVTSAYAIAVFGGTIAAVGLLLRRAWAFPAFVISLLAIVVQMSYALFMSQMLAVQGAAAAIMPILVTLIAVYLVYYSRSAKKKGWIR